MKNTLLIAALTLMSASAFASKARVNSLQAPAHLSDFSDVLTKPDQAMSHGDMVNIEFGTKETSTATGSNNASPRPQGGFVRKMDNSAMGLYLGNQTFSSNTYRAIDSKFLRTENTLNFIYAMDMGDMTAGAGLAYSKSSRKPDSLAISPTNPEKSQDLMGLYLSAAGKNTWDAQLSFGLMGSSKYLESSGGTETKLSGKTSLKLSGGMWMDTMYAYAYYSQAGAKSETGSTTNFDRSDSDMKLGVENTHKKDGSTFFYGAALKMTTAKEGQTGGTSLGTGIEKADYMTIPLNMGVEADVASWLTLRGSLTQNFSLMDSTKISTATTTAVKDDGASDTTVAAGAGLKFGNMKMDGVLSAGDTTGGVFGADGTNFLAQTSFTYNF